MKLNAGILFIVTGLVALLLGMLFGVIGAFHFATTDYINTLLPFYKLRPLHVTFVLSWIILSAVGGIYFYLPRIYRHNKFSHAFSMWHYVLFALTGIGIISSYLFGNFEGREYFEFPAIFFIPIMIGWALFAINLFSSVKFKNDPMPVYIWMWLVGSVFMLVTLTEANFWRLPHFGNNVIRDITIQWKSNGSMVGCWNMLVYGTATFLMTRLSGDKSIATKPIAYALFFLGFTNLLFNWGHHVYPLPQIENIKIISYAISMTELIILGKIIRDWRIQPQTRLSEKFKITHQLLVLSEKWVFLNLSLAILMSIPAVNMYTHGTHITVAHSMGTTIGINTLILLASVFYIFNGILSQFRFKHLKQIKTAIDVFHVSLLIFWVSLIVAGIIKGVLEHNSDMAFKEIMNFLSPFFVIFLLSGITLLVSTAVIVRPLFVTAFEAYENQLRLHKLRKK